MRLEGKIAVIVGAGQSPGEGLQRMKPLGRTRWSIEAAGTALTAQPTLQRRTAVHPSWPLAAVVAMGISCNKERTTFACASG
jgi:hypothetical protein